ncbi:SusC/RagA family TonB-linked outer membrane protein [Mucilaginibacter sp. Bleaf8]|uniref:SusC/RagA family TonB-linked outer membrane protein n=1 Tax=Mucilaginibacter sp. Bleaf8 TaxID=2834430 RepID=UPI001BCBD92D|nr:SusC/RagA family TonB-linked outer membrane protein [Mucilaginibacter sp. Bleaf8]MBS7567084.1 SusC/RagA family TonB-linked outer membrane protein [Mucilaginibacter sp. Bleaf8]
MKKKIPISFLRYSVHSSILFIILLFTNTAYAVAASADVSLSQVKCSLHAERQPLLQIFEQIQKQTPYSIACVNQTGFLQKTISIDAPNSNLETVLKQLALKANFTYRTLNHQIIVQPQAASTETPGVARIIKGQVTDNKNQILPGVSILVKGSNTGTTTGQEGEFSIKANTGDILVISYIGFHKKEVTVTEQNTYKIILEEDAKGLSEVVVTALGIKKEKAKLGYAVQEVQGPDLVVAREPNVINSLTGRVAGLNIQNSTDLFQDPQISLRGRKPLIVIDGIPDQSADLWKINGDDVESMSILKGASASALYGSIGQNGAIMITTKRGKSKDLSVELNSTTEFQPSFIRIPKVQTEYGAGFKGKYTYVDGSGGGPEGSGWIWGPKLDQPDPTTPSGFFETPQFNSPIDPATGQRVPLPFISRGKNNVPDFFRTGIISSNNISISQSNEKGAFRASASHIYQRGIVPNTDLKNSSFNVSGNYKLSQALTMDARLSYNRQYTNNFPETGYGPTNYLYNLILWTGADVDVKDLRNYWIPGKEGIQQRNYNNSYYNNPYFQAYEYLRGYDKDNTFGSLNLNYKISPAFSIQFRNGINAYGLNRTYKEPKSYIGYGNKSRGQFTVATQNYFDIATDLIGDYNHTFTEKFKLHAQVGGYNYYRNFKYSSTNTDGLNIPGFYNLSNSSNPIQGTNFLEERRTSSIYGVLDLELLNGLYLSATGRNDIISTLPTQNNSFFYPSVSASAVISQLTKLPDWFTYLKARGSWSRVSSATLNDNAYTYSYLPSYNKGITWNNLPSLSYGDAILNASLHPQTSDSWEIGLDAKFFRNRLSMEATYYQTKDYNNIVSIPVSITSAYNSQLQNGNVYQRKGLEFVLSGSPIRNKNFKWDITANLSHYRRYLKEIYGNAETLNYLRVGDRTDKIFASVYQKDPQGNVIYDSNGFPVNDTFQRFVGNQDPALIYGLENAFSYHSFTLKFLVDGRLGGMMYSTTNQKMWWGGTHPGTVNQYRVDANAGLSTYVGNGVVVTGGQVAYDANGNITSDTRTFAPNTKAVNYIDYMTNTSNGANNNYNYFSQTFLKLREVTLSWQLPNKWLQKSFVKGITVSAVGRNLLLLSKMPNVDPDPAVDNLQTPSTRTIGFNANIKF